ncbi:hypothetical protein GS429_20580 [Natronorubrum sp. JWXQ-INN-674]|uniref:Uncharacterized protein n=1 Tax=Natronorubrum halalkaliphilum TaxID=2691917 RepID=A0A6B0VS09_9EURY|nr:hypothetical protein [Natronorubrum halalkaliphilum]MXV64420.1 hypothetical protein [Natronorubrum halalkaliphilum]
MDRRRYLSASSGLVAGATVGLAGCLGVGTSASDGIDDEFDDPFDGDYDCVTRWVPAPSVLDTDDYIISSWSPAELVATDDALEDDALEPVEYQLDRLGVDSLGLRDLDRIITTEYVDDEIDKLVGFAVYEGDIDPATVGPALEDDGPDHVGHEDGYDYYGNSQYVHAVADGTVITSSDASGGRSVIDSLIEVENGDERRYADEFEGINRVVDRLPEAHMTRTFGRSILSAMDISADVLEELVFDISVVQIQEDNAHYGFVLVFEEGNEIDERDLEPIGEELKEESSEEATYGTDGSIGWIRLTEPAAEFRAGYS